ncbi:unknown [Bacteroides sp. CAG:144]|nr:unknown [Bacteroides sp. CAG:144]
MFEPAHRYIERLVAAQGQKRFHKRTGCLPSDFFFHPRESNMVGNTPAGRIFFGCKIIARHNPAITCRIKIRPHIGKIGIASINHFRIIPNLSQRACNSRQRLRLRWGFHNRRRRLCRITAKDRNQPPVGPETIRIKMGKIDSFLG